MAGLLTVPQRGNGIPNSPPGEISEETEWIVTYEGIGEVVIQEVFLPLVSEPK